MVSYKITQIQSIEQNKRGIITHLVPEGKPEPERYKYSSIRAGLSWPGSHPAYFIILGEEHLNYIDQHAGYRKKITFLSEYQCEDLDLEIVFDKLTDDLILTGGKDIYTDVSGHFETFQQQFWTWQDRKRQNKFILHKAPFAENWTSGISDITARIKDKTLILKDNLIIKEQLKKIARSDLNKNPREHFWAVEALCHVVSSFKKYPTRNIESDSFKSYPSDGCSTQWMAI